MMSNPCDSSTGGNLNVARRASVSGVPSRVNLPDRNPPASGLHTRRPTSWSSNRGIVFPFQLPTNQRIVRLRSFERLETLQSVRRRGLASAPRPGGSSSRYIVPFLIAPGPSARSRFLRCGSHGRAGGSGRGRCSPSRDGLRLASAAWMIWSRERPTSLAPGPIRPRTLVAMTTSCRLAASDLPRISSESPTE